MVSYSTWTELKINGLRQFGCGLIYCLLDNGKLMITLECNKNAITLILLMLLSGLFKMAIEK